MAGPKVSGFKTALRCVAKPVGWVVPNRLQYLAGVRSTPFDSLRPWNIPRGTFAQFGGPKVEKRIERALVKAGYLADGLNYRGDRIAEHQESLSILRSRIGDLPERTIDGILSVVDNCPIRTETQRTLFDDLRSIYSSEDQIIANPILTIPLNMMLAVTIVFYKLNCGTNFMHGVVDPNGILEGLGQVALVGFASLHWLGRSLLLPLGSVIAFNVIALDGVENNLNYLVFASWLAYALRHGRTILSARRLMTATLKQDSNDQFCLSVIKTLEQNAAGKRTLQKVKINV